MKKQKMIRACVCLSIVMLIQLCPTYASEEAITDSQIQQLISLQERAVAANDNINNGMGFNNDGSIDYEDDFAGAEIIGDKLVISLVDCSEATKEKYLEWAAEYADAVEFEQAEYAYNYLFEQADEVVEALYEETGVLSQGYYVSEADNAIVIKLDKEKEQVLMKQRASINFDLPVQYKVIDSSDFISTNVAGGTALYNINTGAGISVGCCGYFRGTKSIATCGHGISAVGNKLWVGDENDGAEGFVGSVTYHNFNTGSSGDYAIISGSNSNYNFTNKIGTTYSIKGTVTSPAVGTYVYFYGATTQKYCFGLVDERGITYNGTYKGEEISISGLSVAVVLDGTLAEGDSGGTVFTVESGTTNAKFAGVMNVRSGATGRLELYFTPASYFTAIGFSVMTS